MTPASDVKSDAFRNMLAGFLIGSFVGTIPFLFFKDIPTSNKEIVTYIIGQLSGMATTALAFYFTTKAGDQALEIKRAENTKAAFEAVAVAAASPGPNKDAGQAADAVADAAADKADEIKGDKL